MENDASEVHFFHTLQPSRLAFVFSNHGWVSMFLEIFVDIHVELKGRRQGGTPKLFHPNMPQKHNKDGRPSHVARKTLM